MKIVLCNSLMAGLLLSLCACGTSHSSGDNSPSQAPPPVSHTVFAPYIQDINKAKQVQNTVNAQKQVLDRAIQAQTGSSQSPAPSAQTPR